MKSVRMALNCDSAGWICSSLAFQNQILPGYHIDKPICQARLEPDQLFQPLNRMPEGTLSGAGPDAIVILEKLLRPGIATHGLDTAIVSWFEVVDTGSLATVGYGVGGV